MSDGRIKITIKVLDKASKRLRYALPKSNHELRREFWSQFEPVKSPKTDKRIEYLATRKNMTMAEAFFILDYRLHELWAAIKASFKDAK